MPVMLRAFKRSIILSLNKLGYFLLKRSEYERLVAAAARPPCAAPEPQPPPPPSPSESMRFAAVEPTVAPEALSQFFADAQAQVPVSSTVTVVLGTIARYLTAAEVPGSILDCGFGTVDVLTVLALAFRHLGDTSRQLVLFDTSADPLHRAETELRLWGSESDLLATAHAAVAAPKPERPPTELIATGYPPERIAVRRYPREEIAECGELAFLGLTSQTYPANRDAIEVFFPRLSRGGVIAVSGDPLEVSRSDAVEEYLRRQGSPILFVPITANWRIGVKC